MRIRSPVFGVRIAGFGNIALACGQTTSPSSSTEYSVVVPGSSPSM